MKDNENLIKAYRELATLTGHPVFRTICLYMQRTGNVITLGDLNKEQEDSLTI